MHLLKLMKSLCNFAKRYSLSKKAFTSSNGEGVFIVQYLEDIAKIFMKRKSIGAENLEIRVSKGRGNVPKIFWISILPRGFSPADTLSVTICFGKNGDGIVAGLMVPKLGAFHDMETVNRDKDGIIDIDGDKEATKYNNCYINPLEIRIENFDEDILFSHIDKSILLLNETIRNGENSYKNLYADNLIGNG